MVRNYCQNHNRMTNSWIPPLVNSKDGVDFAMLFPLRLLQRWGLLSALQPASVASRYFKNILYNRVYLLLNDLTGYSYSAIHEKKIIIKPKIKTRSWEARKRVGQEVGKL